MHVLHLNWSSGALRIWAESLPGYLERRTAPGAVHPYALAEAPLAASLAAAELLEVESLGEPGPLQLWLPTDDHGPRPSDRLSALAGQAIHDGRPRLQAFEIPALSLRNDQALAALLALEERGPHGEVAFGHDVPFWIAVARFVVELLA